MEKAVIESSSNEPKRKIRIEWIDVAKFFGIIFVIIGHRAGIRILNMFLFSFHVPLFFILSGMTFSFSKTWEEFGKKTFKRFVHLIVPYLISLTFVFVVVLIRDNAQFFSRTWWINQTYRYIGYVAADFNTVHALWFLFALFTASVIFDFLHIVIKNDGILFVACTILTLIGVFFGINKTYMPLSLDVSLAVLIFLCFGSFLKRYDFKKHIVLRNIICLIVWIVTMTIMWFSTKNGTYMAISNRRYTLFPLCYICSIVGSLLFMQLCIWLCKIKYVYKPFAFLGRYTLYMVCVHGVGQFVFKYWLQLSDNTHINNMIYFAVGTGVFLVLLLCDILYHKIKSNLSIKSKNA